MKDTTKMSWKDEIDPQYMKLVELAEKWNVDCDTNAIDPNCPSVMDPRNETAEIYLNWPDSDITNKVDRFNQLIKVFNLLELFVKLDNEIGLTKQIESLKNGFKLENKFDNKALKEVEKILVKFELIEENCEDEEVGQDEVISNEEFEEILSNFDKCNNQIKLFYIKKKYLELDVFGRVMLYNIVQDQKVFLPKDLYKFIAPYLTEGLQLEESPYEKNNGTVKEIIEKYIDVSVITPHLTEGLELGGDTDNNSDPL